MNLTMKQEQENHDTAENIAPLSSDEIKSILKSQSESIFEDKNISNNSNFVKKSLIDIALDFESNQKNEEEEVANNKIPENSDKLEIENDAIKDEKKIEEIVKDENHPVDQVAVEHINNLEEINKIKEENPEKVENEIQTKSSDQNETLTNVNVDGKERQDNTNHETKTDEFISADDQTQQALDSVRDAVSQSMNENQDEGTKSIEDSNDLIDNVSETIDEDYHKFKNILSSLSTLCEKSIFEVFKNKILEISYELAGYQIDKMPEKYEKKIKSFLKNINCYEEKITIEVNDKDFEALSRLKDFNKNEDKKVFISNKELSRGDIILNCDGMRYSEKSNYSV